MTISRTLFLTSTPLLALLAGCATTPSAATSPEDAFMANLRA